MKRFMNALTILSAVAASLASTSAAHACDQCEIHANILNEPMSAVAAIPGAIFTVQQVHAFHVEAGIGNFNFLADTKNSSTCVVQMKDKVAYERDIECNRPDGSERVWWVEGAKVSNWSVSVSIPIQDTAIGNVVCYFDNSATAGDLKAALAPYFDIEFPAPVAE